MRPVGVKLFHADRRDEANSRLWCVFRKRLKPRGR